VAANKPLHSLPWPHKSVPSSRAVPAGQTHSQLYWFLRMHMSPCEQQPWAVQPLSMPHMAMPPQGAPARSKQVLELGVCVVVADAGDAVLGAAVVLLLPPKPPGITRTSGDLGAVPEEPAVPDGLLPAGRGGGLLWPSDNADLGGGLLVFEASEGGPAFFLAAKSCEDHTSWQRPSRMSRQPSLVSSAV
jgi:hypothetical protein